MFTTAIIPVVLAETGDWVPWVVASICGTALAFLFAHIRTNSITSRAQLERKRLLEEGHEEAERVKKEARG